jgi:hypothetical protein
VDSDASDAMHSSDDGDPDEDEDIRDNNNESDPFALLKATQEYEKLCEDFDAELVLAALISSPTSHLDGLTEWCYEEHTKEELRNILAGYCSEEKGKKDQVLSAGASNKEVSVSSIGQPRLEARDSMQGEAPMSIFTGLKGARLKEQFAAVWTQFLDRADSLDSKECLSFQLLAGCLDDLVAGTTSPQRRFLAQFSEGSPSLVVCAEAEMHALALAFYMHDPDKRLPGLDEVLLCQPDTPLEQVT